MSLLTRAGWRDHARHPLQSILCLLGVALGVAVILAVDLAVSSAGRSFALTVDALSDRATHVVVGGPGGVPAEVYRDLVIDHPEIGVAPVIERDAALLPPREGRISLLGIDPWAEQDLRPSMRLDADPETFDVGLLAATLGGAWMQASRAAELDLSIGDRFDVRIGSRTSTLELTGVFEPRDRAMARAGSDLVLVDLATIEEALGRFGRLDRIDLEIDAEQGPPVATIEAGLPDGVRIETQGARRGALERMMAAFRANLRFLSLLALLVGAFLIYNTLSFSVVRRRPIFGRLKAFGVERGEILRVVLLEGALFGLVGSAIGIGLGILLAAGLLDVVSETVGDLYHKVTVRRLALDPAGIAFAFGAGVVGSLVAVIPPALEAARQEPRLTQGRGPIAREGLHSARPLLLLGAVGLALAAIFPLLPERALWPCYVLLVGLVLAFSALTPLVARGLVRALEPLCRKVGPVGRLGIRGVRAGLGRTSTAMAALAFALAMGLGVTIMIGSFREAVDTWLSEMLNADVFISLPAGVARSAGKGAIDPEVIRIVEGLAPGGRVVANRNVRVMTDRGESQLVAFDFARKVEFSFPVIEGDRDEAWEAFRSGTGVLVTEPWAWRRRVGLGDRIALDTPTGRHVLPIAGIFRDYATEDGYVVMHRDAYRERFVDERVSALAIFAAEGTDADALAAAVETAVAGKARLNVRSIGRVRTYTFEVFDRTFRVTIVLRLLAIVVAFIGFVGALVALQIDRDSELARLEARGMASGELQRIRLLQTTLEGGVAGLVALPLGLIFAWVLTAEVNRRSFGWSLPLDPTASPFFETFGVALVAALLAALLAGRGRTRRAIAQRLREE